MKKKALLLAAMCITIMIPLTWQATAPPLPLSRTCTHNLGPEAYTPNCITWRVSWHCSASSSSRRSFSAANVRSSARMLSCDQRAGWEQRKGVPRQVLIPGHIENRHFCRVR